MVDIQNKSFQTGQPQWSISIKMLGLTLINSHSDGLDTVTVINKINCPKVTYSYPRVTYSDPKVTHIDPKVTHIAH